MGASCGNHSLSLHNSDSIMLIDHGASPGLGYKIIKIILGNGKVSSASFSIESLIEELGAKTA